MQVIRLCSLTPWKSRRHPWPAIAQADAGAQVVQIFDSWASQLSPQDFDVFSAPYIKQIIEEVRKVHQSLL